MYSIPSLRYTAAAARLGSFSAAARECGVKQPTVSAAVSDLEAALGAPLFARGTRPLALTPAGVQMMARINAVLLAIDDLDQAALAMTSPTEPQLRLGFTPLMGASRLGLLLDPFRKAHADVKLVFYESGGAELESRLDAGGLDIIFGVGLRAHRLRKRVRLFNDPLGYRAPVLAADRAATITLKKIATRRLLMTEDLCGLATATRGLFAAAGLAVDEYAGRAMSYGALEDWVELDLGGAVLPWAHLRNPQRAIPVVDERSRALGINVEAVWRKDLLVSKQAQALVAYLHRVVPGLMRGMGRNQR